MGNLLKNLVQESQKLKILYRWEWVVTNGISVIAQFEMGEYIQAYEDR
jgi:hypothetical protein